ncbi:MAG TPA: hypothetical protein VFO10_02830 [Oligoflexus sp.]|uniref:hypothetical protein n=1 Tax=Oligoflexus sp. TaxID=1971216 RepID=UPI002D803D79|nr:hypothetical protein [Oligoflexus sp.]HET9236157.1 hypothetical protein [Oligoflexus sp.]
MAALFKALVVFLKGLFGFLKLEFRSLLILPAFTLVRRPRTYSAHPQYQQPGIFAWEAAQLLPL